jgi:hypothetical protein
VSQWEDAAWRLAEKQLHGLDDLTQDLRRASGLRAPVLALDCCKIDVYINSPAKLDDFAVGRGFDDALTS